MKHVSLVSRSVNGKAGWRLIGEGGVPVSAFDAFNDSLAKGHPTNTRKAYCFAVARFIDYLIEGEKASEGGMDRARIRDLVEAYPEWLTLGAFSGHETAKELAAKIASPALARRSADLALAAVKRFLELSERLRAEQAERGLDPSSVDAIPLWEEMGEARSLPTGQRLAMAKKSMLAGVLAGGPKLTRSWALSVAPASVDLFDQEAAFPFDRALGLIKGFSSYRDQALYALCAASGCRSHEAIQLLWEDIDLKGRTVKLIDPASRITHPSYLALGAEERDKLSWKGRTSSSTLLIQPFKDIFFERLEAYRSQERVEGKRHDFVFQYATKKEKDRPFFLSQPAGRGQAFSAARSKLSLPKGKAYGVHSLRHMYGTYLVNYFPNSSGGHGLPMEIVQKLMGHRSISITQKYAKHDAQLIGADIGAAFESAANPDGKSALEIKRDILAASLASVERLIEQDQTKRLR